MTQTADRDAINPETLAQAVAAYRWNDDEADIAFEAVLLEQGIINPAEAVVSIEPIGLDLLVILESQQLSVFRDGSVHVWDRAR